MSLADGFSPSGARGQSLDLTMRSRLAKSLEHIFKQVGEDLGVAPATARLAIASIRSTRQSPHTFGAYYDLVLAIEQDEIDTAKALASEILQRTSAPAPTAWGAALDDRPAPDRERYVRLLLPQEIEARHPNQEQFSAAKGRIDAAMDLLDRGYPAMAEEIRELLYEIVIAVGPDDPKALTFDGSSSYMLWGAIMLNAQGQQTVLDTAQALAHESGHNLLFGKCTSSWLVENDDDELFDSPLRIDPRPMDGLFHAAYVIARMHQTLEALLRSDVLDAEQTKAAHADLALHQKNFADADAVIRRSGRLTPLGLDTIEQARRHMLQPAL